MNFPLFSLAARSVEQRFPLSPKPLSLGRKDLPPRLRRKDCLASAVGPTGRAALGSPSACISDYTGRAMATVSLATHIQPRTPPGGFANEPFVNFKTPANARAMQDALDQVASQLGREYDLIIGGRSLKM